MVKCLRREGQVNATRRRHVYRLRQGLRVGTRQCRRKIYANDPPRQISVLARQTPIAATDLEHMADIRR